jgi:methyl-accepting chemotaxis protein
MKNLTIKLKLTGTFLIIGILVVILASYSVISISKVSNGFIKYRNMSKDSAIAAQIQSKMLLVRMNVKEYISNPIEEEISKFNKRFLDVEKTITLAKTKIKDQKRNNLVKKLKENANEYKNTFFLISSINQERDDIISNNLERNAQRIEQFLNNILDNLKESGDTNTMLKTSEAIKLLLDAKVYTTKFLSSYSKNDLDKAKNVFVKLSGKLKEIEKNIDGSPVQSRLRLAKRFISVYQNGTLKIEEIISERDSVINGRLNKIGFNMEKLAENIRTSIKKEQELIGLEVEGLNNNIQKLTIFISIFNLIFIIVISFIIPRNISKLIDTLQAGLMNFFKYLNNETNDAKLIPLDSNDEIGTMSRVINQNITKTKLQIDQDSALIEDVKSVVMKVKEGKIKQTVSKSTQNEKLEELKTIFNEMLEVMAKNVTEDLNIITKALSSYQQLDFRYRIENQTGLTAKGLNTLAEIINGMLMDNKNNGLALDKSSDRLLENVDILNKNANHSAAAIEETSAALEEVTNNIADNTKNIVKMASYTQELTTSANEGQNLSNETTNAMNEINEQVNSINEAIAVIDQISFQTNILSLNAAVEAATAGEAGKGFAVVAGEVRNLASRSAEAAKKIKDLVESATQKADNGKVIASKMIKGYSVLNENISKTIELISDIEQNSKEQQLKIEQINAAVTTLDSQTQENATISSKTHGIALETDKIAKLIVNTVNEKEFIGKEDKE